MFFHRDSPEDLRTLPLVLSHLVPAGNSPWLLQKAEQGTAATFMNASMNILDVLIF